MFAISTSEQAYPAKAMFVVPKKNFRKSHDRNKLKRRMREAYRLNKHLLYESELLANKKILLAFIYVSKKPSDFKHIETAILTLKKKLEKSLGTTA
jgi:ribonuclease P protein component